MFFNKTGISRDFCYVFRTMLVALLVIFTENFAFASCPAGKIEYIENGSSVCSENKFQITTVPNTSSFAFSISAKGTFYVDCDTNSSEDVVQKIAKNNTNSVKVTCTYSIPGEYNIGFGGLANGYEVGHITDYSEDKTSGKDRCSTWGVIQFNTYSDAKKIAKVSGSIGKIFPTLSDGLQPTFRNTFSGTQNLTSVPGNLFDGIHGTPGNCMFAYTFASGAIKKIPIGLFSYISGTSEGLLFGTFAYSTGLEEIDIGILRTIKGEQKPFMFYSTFNSGSNQFTSIPEDLFGGITGVPSGGLFFDTFRGSKITKLPNRVFSGLYGKPANQSLKNMFALSYNLSGYIPCTFFENLNSSGFSSSGDTSPLDSIFNSSRLLSACPKDMYKKVTGFEGDLDGAVVCCQCPNGGTSSAGAVGVERCSAASVICEAGKYLSSNQTSCSACPSAYPNSPRGARSISQCYATVTYKFNNGSEDISVDIPYSSSSPNSYSVKLPEPSKTDYAFVGWYENSNFSGNVLDNPATLSGNKTLYAQWTQIKCNPGNYLAQNGLSCLSCPTAYPNSIYDSKNIYNCFATVTFYPNNNTDNTKENFYYTDANAQGYKIDKTPATNTQYEFIGWFDNSAFSGNPVTKTTVLSGNKNLYAQYGYLIEYDLDGGHLAYNKTNPSGYKTTDSPFTLNNPTKTGYSFAGWCKGNKTCSNAQTVMIIDPATLSGNQKFYATWTPETYSIRYQDGDTQITTVQTPTQYTFSETNQTFTPTPEPTKKAYKFIGWSASNSDQTNYSKTISVPANTTGTKTFYAVWELIGYDIHYETNGGQNNPENPQIYTISELPLELKPATKTGYIFNGWFDNSGLNGEPLTEIQSNTTGEINLYAKWTPITYNVVFNSNGGAGYKSGIVCTYDSYCDISNNEFEYDGHEYLGWDTNRKAITPTYIETTNGIKVMNLTSTNNETILLYAIWKEKQIELKYIYNNITSLDSCQYNNSFTTMTPPANAKPGFRFAGWVKE